MIPMEVSSPKLSSARIPCQDQPSDATHRHVQTCPRAGKWPPGARDGGKKFSSVLSVMTPRSLITFQCLGTLN